MVEKTEQSKPLEVSEEPFQMVIPEYSPCDCDNDGEETKSKPASNCAKQEKKEKAEGELQAKKEKMCYKCKVNKATVTNKQEVSCKECLMFMLTHRFKNAIVRYVRIQKDYPNLVAVSGGSNSMAMLHLLYSCLNGNKQAKKMFFKVHILYIDEGTIFGLSPQERENNRQMIEDACVRYGFNISTVYLESVFDLDVDLKNGPSGDLEADIYMQAGS